MCHMSGVRCHVSGVTYQVSGVRCHMYFFFFYKLFDAFLMRKFYDRKLDLHLGIIGLLQKCFEGQLNDYVFPTQWKNVGWMNLIFFRAILAHILPKFQFLIFLFFHHFFWQIQFCKICSYVRDIFLSTAFSVLARGKKCSRYFMSVSVSAGWFFIEYLWPPNPFFVKCSPPCFFL